MHTISDDSRYLLVQGWTGIHPRPSNHLQYYSRSRRWTKILRESPMQHLSPEEDTAKLVVSVAIFPKDTNFITKIRTSLLETGDNNTVNLDLNADTIFPDRIYLKQWEDPARADDRHIKVKEELESAKCYSIEFSGRLCSDIEDERCTAEKRNDLLEPEPTTEPVTSCLGVPVLSTHKPETKGPTTRSKARQAATVLPESFRTPTATLPRTSADVSRLACWSRSA